MTASTFRQLHAGPDLLVLPNAWDAASARLFESLGARAVATTSAGFAWACGWPDGDALPPDELVAATARIARVLQVPLSVDIEGGLADDPHAVADTVARLLDLGVAGINIEDGDGAPAALCAKLVAIRARAARDGHDLYVNVRTDVYLRGLASGDAAVDETIRRARQYRDAGGDGLFVPGLAALDAVGSIVAAVGPMPLNLMWVPGLPAHDALRAAGVRRLSAGAAIAKRVLAIAGTLASDFLAGDSQDLLAPGIDYAAMNALLAAGDG